MSEIKSIDSLTHEEIIHAARAAYDAGHHVSDCPYPADTKAGSRWTKAFIGFELADQGETV